MEIMNENNEANDKDGGHVMKISSSPISITRPHDREDK
ncbi:uncharacterized protein G2W53_001936 [Senna tora]|uniref:Uncharacterized protein n=1 Tax=Senna tora TaxID=362788 RepID=A0A834XJJ9_9FABA|nr:uncharacterized protein G2W53_001936 [Senna tora]